MHQKKRKEKKKKQIRKKIFVTVTGTKQSTIGTNENSIIQQDGIVFWCGATLSGILDGEQLVVSVFLIWVVIIMILSTDEANPQATCKYYIVWRSIYFQHITRGTNIMAIRRAIEILAI